MRDDYLQERLAKLAGGVAVAFRLLRPSATAARAAIPFVQASQKVTQAEIAAMFTR